jgi:hypothetical protein
MDFRKATKIGARIDAKDEQLVFGKGYDHNWVLNHYTKKVRKVLDLYDSTSGIVLQILTDQPGLQFYSGNFLNGTIHGKQGVAYQHRTGGPGGAGVPRRAQPPIVPQCRAQARPALPRRPRSISSPLDRLRQSRQARCRRHGGLPVLDAASRRAQRLCVESLVMRSTSKRGAI